MLAALSRNETGFRGVNDVESPAAGTGRNDILCVLRRTGNVEREEMGAAGEGDKAAQTPTMPGESRQRLYAPSATRSTRSRALTAKSRSPQKTVVPRNTARQCESEGHR